MGDPAPIGIFDSGVGGLTVLRAIHEQLPHESTIYLGDTARVPYGTKSPDSVLRYAAQASAQLVDRGVKLLVVACNTASAVALAPLREQLSPLPTVGVVGPGARAAVERGVGSRHLVLATESTVRAHAYRNAIHALTPGARVEEIACSMLVALAEEGWTDGEAADAVIRRYLGAVVSREEDERPDTVVLGCTHFPVLRSAIRRAIGAGPVIVDSATTTASAVADALVRTDGLAPPTEGVRTRVLATDGAVRFAAVGERFLGRRLDPTDVEVVDR